MCTTATFTHPLTYLPTTHPSFPPFLSKAIKGQQKNKRMEGGQKCKKNEGRKKGKEGDYQCMMTTFIRKFYKVHK